MQLFCVVGGCNSYTHFVALFILYLFVLSDSLGCISSLNILRYCVFLSSDIPRYTLSIPLIFFYILVRHVTMHMIALYHICLFDLV